MNYGPSARDNFGLCLSASKPALDEMLKCAYPSRDVLAIDDDPGRDSWKALSPARVDPQGFVDDGL